MKMLFVSAYYPPHHLGGYEMLCHEVATHLTARGHRVTILTSTYRATASQKEPGVHRRLKLESDGHYYKPRQVLRYWADRRTNLRVVRELVAETAPDLVVVWGMWNLSRLVAAWIEELVGSKAVYYLSDQWPAAPSAHKAYWDQAANSLAGNIFKAICRGPVRLAMRREWQPLNLRLEHAVVCSKAVRDKLFQAGVPVGHARVIYHGIDPVPYRKAAEQRLLHKPSETLRAVYVGTLAPHKGVHTAIEAIGRLVENEASVPVSLTVLGAGHPQYETRLRQMTKRWQLDDVVSFHRPIPRSQLPQFLARFDVLVMPSIYDEPQARISQEAMAAALVLVATLTGGTSEILVDGENGLAFEPEDAEGLAGHLRNLAQSADLRQRLIRAGWQTVTKRFTISRMIDELEAYLTEVAAQSEGAAQAQ